MSRVSCENGPGFIDVSEVTDLFFMALTIIIILNNFIHIISTIMTLTKLGTSTWRDKGFDIKHYHS